MGIFPAGPGVGASPAMQPWMNPGVGASQWPMQQLGAVKKPKLDPLGMMPGLWDTLYNLGCIGSSCKG